MAQWSPQPWGTLVTIFMAVYITILVITWWFHKNNYKIMSTQHTMEPLQSPK